MPTLSDFQGQSLVPDLTQSLNQILGLVNAARQQKKQEEINNAVGQAIDQAMTAPQDEQMRALGRIARIDINAAKSVGQILASGNKAHQEALARAADDVIKTSAYLLGIDDPTMRNKEFARVINEKQKAGQDTSNWLEIATLPADQQSLRLKKIALTGADTKKVVAHVLGLGEKVPGFSNIQRTADGGLIGLSDKTGQMERIQLPEGVQLEAKTPMVSISNAPVFNPNASKALGTKVGDIVAASQIKTTGAVKMYRDAERIDEAIKSGNVILGPLANKRLGFARLAEVLGIKGDDRVARTRSIVRSLASSAVEARKELAGQGPITEGENKAVEKAMSGDIESLTIEELSLISGLNKRAAYQTTAQHQQYLQSLPQEEADLIPFYNVRGADEILKKGEPQEPMPGPPTEQSKPDEVRTGPDGRKYFRYGQKWFAQ